MTPRRLFRRATSTPAARPVNAPDNRTVGLQSSIASYMSSLLWHRTAYDHSVTSVTMAALRLLFGQGLKRRTLASAQTRLKGDWTPASKSTRPLSDDELAAFRSDGFVRVRGVFDREEVQLLHDTVVADKVIQKHDMKMVDSEGMASRLTLWRHAGTTLCHCQKNCHCTLH